MRRHRGITLLEVMLVVLVIAILLTIAVPYWLTARSNAHKKSCFGNVRKYETAKAQWAMAENIPSHTPVNLVDIQPYLRNTPMCPGAGIYDLQTINIQTTCTVHDHTGL